MPSISTRDLAAITAGGGLRPRRRTSGSAISIFSSLAVALIIGVFFIGMAGWRPDEARQEIADFTVTWVLLTYIWIQMGTLILVGAGSKNQMWIDALSSIVPLFIVLYVVVQHQSGYVVLSSFQAKAAWATAYTMLLDVVIDLGVTVLLSRQVVDVAGGGVG
ncbi:MAG: hypothetical protein NW223_21810 [Hyphomicrobiaceae bacterium]|nr:hypothetical protein [Hyphomicrobiaceae bacterium]